MARRGRRHSPGNLSRAFSLLALLSATPSEAQFWTLFAAGKGATVLQADRHDLPTLPGALRFTVPAAAVAVYRAWRRQADHDYLRVQLERQGRATVVRLGERHGLLTIAKLPEPGDGEPFYGTFGGGFPFIFRPTRYACRLEVEAPPVLLFALPPDQMTHPPVAAPLELAVEPLELLAEAIATPGDYGVLDDCPDDETLPWRFAVAGQMVTRLADHGWEAAVPAAYAYRFTSTNVGCFVCVVDEKRGIEIDLTADFAA